MNSKTDACYTPCRPAGTLSTQDLIHRDGRPVPEDYVRERGRFLGDEDIPFEVYTSQRIFDLEMERMWTRTWQWACREEHVREPGDYYVYEIGPHSVLVMRDRDGSVRAYVNSCLHRGTKFRMGGTSGHCEELRCPFHGWTWSIGGELQRIPYQWDAPHVNKADFRLPEVRVATWGGFVFVNLDPQAPPLEQYMAPMPELLERFDLDHRYVALHIEKELYANWKAAKEAFIENYHTQETHPQLLFGSNDEGTQYDILGDHVSRFICAFGVPSPLVQPPPSEQQIVDTMLISDRSNLGDDLTVKEGESARVVMARLLRRIIGEAAGVDLSRYSDVEMIDVVQYTLVPSMLLFPHLSLSMVYRFRPLGHDVNRSLFEILLLKPFPPGSPRPEPAEPYRLKEEDSFTTVPGFDPHLGHVYDQDTGNLRAQQEGFRAARKRGETLLNYQEVRVRHLEQAVQRYLKD